MNDTRLALKEAIEVGDVTILIAEDLVYLNTLIQQLEAEVGYKTEKLEQCNKYRLLKGN